MESIFNWHFMNLKNLCFHSMPFYESHNIQKTFFSNMPRIFILFIMIISVFSITKIPI